MKQKTKRIIGFFILSLPVIIMTVYFLSIGRWKEILAAAGIVIFIIITGILGMYFIIED